MMFLFQTIDFQLPAVSFPLGHSCNLEIRGNFGPTTCLRSGVQTQAFLPGYGPKYGGMPARLGGDGHFGGQVPLEGCIPEIRLLYPPFRCEKKTTPEQPV